MVTGSLRLTRVGKEALRFEAGLGEDPVKRNESSAQRTPLPNPPRMRAVGLYGEVAVRPLNRADPAPLPEPKSFI